MQNLNENFIPDVSEEEGGREGKEMEDGGGREGKEMEDDAGKSEPAATFLSATENINTVRKYPIKFMLMITLLLPSTVLSSKCTGFSRK